MSKKSIYMAIDLKSFYASVECKERQLDPLTTHLVVADSSRTEKTICLAVSPSLKKYGIGGRARLFEVVQKVKEINKKRKHNSSQGQLIGKSWNEVELNNNKDLALDYVIAPPRMAFYMEYSTKIYEIYLKYIASEDIHVYSIDEVFIDVTHYLKTYNLSPKELARKIMKDVYDTTGITATCGIGTNLYLCKVAMDIVAKHMSPDEYGARIAQLDEDRYKKYLWNYRPITDFWRVGKGYEKRLIKLGLYTMGDIAKCSIGKDSDYYNEELLYKTFGINAELLIDHAWGYEPCTMKDIKEYNPENKSLGTGQVLGCPYSVDKARIVLKEMIDTFCLGLVEKGLVTDQIILTIGYDIENIEKGLYYGKVTVDRYGRSVPQHLHGTISLHQFTHSTKIITMKVLEFFDSKVQSKLTIKRINISANHIHNFSSSQKPRVEQLNFFSHHDNYEEEIKKERDQLEKEKKIQEATIKIKKKYGKSAIIKGMDLQDGATTLERNDTIGGHKA